MNGKWREIIKRIKGLERVANNSKILRGVYMFKSIECWVCGADMNYLYDKEIEDIGFYRFDCTKCDESVLCPKKAPFLKKE